VKWRNRKGSILIMTLLICTIIFMLAVSYSTMVTLETNTANIHNNANMALYVADAGIRRGFADLVNLREDQFATLTGGTDWRVEDVAYNYEAEEVVGNYSVTVEGTPENGNFGPVEPIPSDAGGSDRGFFTYRFTIESNGTISRNGDVVARRTVIARVLLERAEGGSEDTGSGGVDDYQGYGRIEDWYEKHR